MSKRSFGGAFKKLKEALSGKPARGDDTVPSKRSKYLESDKGPLDVQFAREFTEATGKFLYCEHEAGLVENLHRLSLEYNWVTVHAREDNLYPILQRANIDFDREDTNADAFVSTCAFLSAYDGGIVVSSVQTGGKKLNHFPSTHVVIAYTSQLHKNLSEGMRWLKSKSKEIPSNITNVQVNRLENANGTRYEYGPSVHHDVFLLLVEDQVPGDLVQIYTTDQEYQATIVAGKLREAGIEPFQFNKRDSMYPVGYHEIRVASDQAEKARDLVGKSGL